MSNDDEARKASEQFYAALTRMCNGDAGPMADIWSHGSDVTTMHPIGGREVGWDKVRESFHQVAQIASEGHVTLQDRIVRIDSDLAYELGFERGSAKIAGQPVAFDHRVTNIYRREAGKWKIIHHHSDVAPALVDVLNGLRAQP